MKHRSFILMIFIFFSGHTHAQSGLEYAEDFLVKDVNENSHTLYSYLEDGKIVVIPFFTTSCGSSSTYTADIVQSFDDFGCNQSNVLYLGVNWGSNNIGVTDFMSAHAVEYPCASGEEGLGDQVTEQYEIASLITTLVIMPDGTIAGQFYGPDYYPTRDSLNSLLLSLGGQMQTCAVGIDTNPILKAPHMQIISNYGSKQLTVSLNNLLSDSYQLGIFNISGQLIWTTQIEPTADITSLKIPTSHYSSGMYLLKLTHQEVTITTGKFMIQ